MLSSHIISLKITCCSPSFGTADSTPLLLGTSFEVLIPKLTQSKMPDFSLEFASELFLVMRNFLKSLKIQTQYETTARAAASSLIVSGIGLVLLYLYTRRKREKTDQHVFTRSMSMGALHGGKLAMTRLLQYHKVRATQKTQHHYLEKLMKMVNTDSPDFSRLQNTLAKLEMRGEEEKAIEILKRAAKEANEKSLPQHEYEYQMLLVEALIYKGDLEEAEMASCLNNNNDTSDVRRSLYKAIIQELLNKPEKAEEEWEEFKKMRSQFLLPPDVKDSHFYKLVPDFQKFKLVVDLLKVDIDEKKKKKAK